MRSFLFVVACCTLMSFPITSQTEDAKSGTPADCCPEVVYKEPVNVHWIVIDEKGKFWCGDQSCDFPHVKGGEFVAWKLADDQPNGYLEFKKKDMDKVFGISAPKVLVTSKKWTWLRVRDDAPGGTYSYESSGVSKGGVVTGGIIVCPPNQPTCP